MYPSLQYLRESFHCPKNLLCSTYSSLLPPLELSTTPLPIFHCNRYLSISYSWKTLSQCLLTCSLEDLLPSGPDDRHRCGTPLHHHSGESLHLSPGSDALFPGSQFLVILGCSPHFVGVYSDSTTKGGVWAEELYFENPACPKIALFSPHFNWVLVKLLVKSTITLLRHCGRSDWCKETWHRLKTYNSS